MVSGGHRHAQDKSKTVEYQPKNTQGKPKCGLKMLQTHSTKQEASLRCAESQAASDAQHKTEGQPEMSRIRGQFLKAPFLNRHRFVF